MWVDGVGPTQSQEQRNDCEAEWAGGPELALERRLDRMFSLQLHHDRWQRDGCHIIFLLTLETETTKDKIV